MRGRWTLCDRKSVLYLLMRWRLCCQGISRYNTDHMYNLSYIHCIYVIIMDIYQLDDVIIWITISNLTIEHYKGWYSKPQIKRAPKMWMYGGNHWERAQIELGTFDTSLMLYLYLNSSWWFPPLIPHLTRRRHPCSELRLLAAAQLAAVFTIVTCNSNLSHTCMKY